MEQAQTLRRARRGSGVDQGLQIGEAKCRIVRVRVRMDGWSARVLNG